MRDVLGDNAGRLQCLVEGTLRLECQLLQELDGKRPTFYSRDQLQAGLHIMHTQLQDWRWAMTTAAPGVMRGTLTKNNSNGPAVLVEHSWRR